MRRLTEVGKVVFMRYIEEKRWPKSTQKLYLAQIRSSFKIVLEFNDLTHFGGNGAENSQEVLSTNSASIDLETCVPSQVGYGHRKAGCLNRPGGGNEPVTIALSLVFSN